MRVCGPRRSGADGAGASCCGPPDMPEEAGLPPAKRFRPGSCPPGRRVVMLLAPGGGGAGGGRRQTPPLAQPSASPYREALELQRRSLPIFRARGQLLAQLRNLDSAVLIGEWPLWQELPGFARPIFLSVFLTPLALASSTNLKGFLCPAWTGTGKRRMS